MSAAERTPRDTRAAFSFPTLGGARDCRNLVEDFGGIDLVCKLFKVSSDLVNRYISGQIEPPYTFLLALYWQSRYGFDQAFAESHWTHQYNCFRLAESQEKVKQLERVLHHAVRLLEHRSDAADLLREAIDLAKLPPSRNPPGVPVIV